jgi:hypothetical protein
MNEAQISFLKVLSVIKTEKELNELRAVMVKYLAEKAISKTDGVGEKLGVNTKKRAEEFLEKTHFRKTSKK